MSNVNRSEGRDPLVISDSLECGTAALFLSVDFDTFARSLAELGRLGMTELDPSCGLRLVDLAALNRLANSAASVGPDAVHQTH